MDRSRQLATASSFNAVFYQSRHTFRHFTINITPKNMKHSHNSSSSIRTSTTMASQPTGKNSTTTVYSDRSDTLSLNNIRRTLILMEDTIIFSLIERAQFALNDPVYKPGAVPIPWYTPDGQQLSLLEYLLRETEQVHGRIRRFTSPDENAFFPEDLPLLMLPPLSFPPILHQPAAVININDKIMKMYADQVLPNIVKQGDDGNYGSAAMYDVMILQALSRRIHYGKFVAEAKFLKQTKEYTACITAKDSQGILDLLTDRQVELKVIDRVKLKTATFGQDLTEVKPHDQSELNNMLRISPEVVAQIYDEWIMPLTKEVEVEYLLRRLD